ncbi:hypothetical protein QOZ88_02985 [Blastococcus sp. BMG 814]|uniref:Trypsin-co-occurring domain-containing protein n=1 Tax=Blastococcus carthaginiensis TaxID=3050034 RepID=A0ABT9I7N9_9ACTN|nr:trypco2 family protein [Blastococcus carthaginiensis]MDP5181590.1 hypothetical protein [Blastococcus carthaginiensis]
MDVATADLADTLTSLRQQLTSAMQQGERESLRFELGAIEIEFGVVVTRDASAEGGVRFGVVSFGAKGSHSQEVTHRLALTLTPVLDDGARRRPALVRDSTAEEPR